MLTDQQLEEFIFHAEGGNRSPAYDDKQPWKELQPGDEIKGTLTVGPGFTKRRDGSPVQIGDTMTDQEAFERIREYIANEIEPALEDLIHVPIATSLANALGSLVFNFGATEVYGWRLWGRINAGESPLAIINEWIDGTFSSKGEPMLGLWRRRHKEILMAFGKDWRAGDNVSWEDKPDDVLRVMGWDGSMPKPPPIVHKDLFEELEIPKRGADVITDPTPETPLTTADLNVMQEASLKTGKRMSFEPVTMPVGNKPLSINSKSAEQVPYGLDPEAPLQPKEDAERYRRAVKKEKGIEMKKFGEGLTVATGVAASANMASEEVRTFFGSLGQIGYTLLFVALAVGIIYWIVGRIREHHNERKEVEAEINAVQGMF